MAEVHFPGVVVAWWARSFPPIDVVGSINDPVVVEIARRARRRGKGLVEHEPSEACTFVGRIAIELQLDEIPASESVVAKSVDVSDSVECKLSRLRIGVCLEIDPAGITACAEAIGRIMLQIRVIGDDVEIKRARHAGIELNSVKGIVGIARRVGIDDCAGEADFAVGKFQRVPRRLTAFGSGGTILRKSSRRIIRIENAGCVIERTRPRRQRVANIFPGRTYLDGIRCFKLGKPVASISNV